MHNMIKEVVPIYCRHDNRRQTMRNDRRQRGNLHFPNSATRRVNNGLQSSLDRGA